MSVGGGVDGGGKSCKRAEDGNYERHEWPRLSTVNEATGLEMYMESKVWEEQLRVTWICAFSMRVIFVVDTFRSLSSFQITCLAIIL